MPEFTFSVHKAVKSQSHGKTTGGCPAAEHIVTLERYFGDIKTHISSNHDMFSPRWSANQYCMSAVRIMEAASLHTSFNRTKQPAKIMSAPWLPEAEGATRRMHAYGKVVHISRGDRRVGDNGWQVNTEGEVTLRLACWHRASEPITSAEMPGADPWHSCVCNTGAACFQTSRAIIPPSTGSSAQPCSDWLKRARAFRDHMASQPASPRALPATHPAPKSLSSYRHMWPYPWQAGRFTAPPLHPSATITRSNHFHGQRSS